MTDNAPTPERALILAEAERLICGERNAQYGDPLQDFRRTAAIWSALFGRHFYPHEVAMAMAALKLSRLCWSPGKWDSWVDAAGYSALGWECVVGEEKEVDRGTPLEA